jgi:hypothetical protein
MRPLSMPDNSHPPFPPQWLEDTKRKLEALARSGPGQAIAKFHRQLADLPKDHWFHRTAEHLRALKEREQEWRQARETAAEERRERRQQEKEERRARGGHPPIKFQYLDEAIAAVQTALKADPNGRLRRRSEQVGSVVRFLNARGEKVPDTQKRTIRRRLEERLPSAD